MLYPLHIKGLVISVCLITGDVNVDHLANLESSRFLHYRWNSGIYTLGCLFLFPLAIKFLGFIHIIACIICSISLL